MPSVTATQSVLPGLLAGGYFKRRGLAQQLSPEMLASHTQAPTPQPLSQFGQLAQNEQQQQTQLGQDLSRQIQDYYSNTYQPQMASQREALANHLSEFGQNQFNQQNPALLEDLNRRGFLSSPTEVAQAEANAMKDITLSQEPILNQFDQNALAGGQALQQQALEAKLGGQQEGVNSALELQRMELQSQLQQESDAADRSMAENLAGKERRNQTTNSLIGLGGSLLGGGGGFLGGIGKGISGLFGGGGGGAAHLGSTASLPMNSPLSLFGGGTNGAAQAGANFASAPGAAPIPGNPMSGFMNGAVGRAGLTAGAAYGGQLLGNSIFKSKSAEKRARTGATIGAGLGNFIPVPGGQFIGSAIGSTLGGLSKSHAAGQISQQAKNFASKPLKTTVNAPINVSKSIGKSLSKAFCFDGTTPVMMANGTEKDIKDVEIGDETKGGIVDFTSKSITFNGTRYRYKGVVVTGSHAVKENGKWIRVEDSPLSHPVDGEGVVYSLGTATHRIYVKGIVFADFFETDDYETLSIRQSLIALNQQERERTVA